MAFVEEDAKMTGILKRLRHCKVKTAPIIRS